VNDVTWTSSDTSVATVSGSGLLNVVAPGGAEVTATAYGHSGSALVRVPFSISGVIHESPPTQNVAVAGARVEIQGGPENDKTATTDDFGRFTLEVEAAGLTLVATKAGYEPASAVIASLPLERPIEVGLRPTFREVVDTFELPMGGTPVREAVFSIPVHHSGTMVARIQRACLFGCGASETYHICAEIKDGARTIAQDHGSYDDGPRLPAVAVTGGRVYGVRLYLCEHESLGTPAPPEWRLVAYLVEVSHPK
jgi:hypothetical protein